MSKVADKGAGDAPAESALNYESVQWLTRLFANAIGVDKALRALVEAHGYLDPHSYDEIRGFLGWIHEDLGKIGPLVEKLPDAIKSAVVAIAGAVDDRTGSVSFGDYCKHLLDSRLEPIAEQGWRETIRLSKQSKYPWAEASAPPKAVGYTLRDLLNDLSVAESFHQQAAEVAAKIGDGWLSPRGETMYSGKQSYLRQVQMSHGEQARKAESHYLADAGAMRLMAICAAGGDKWAKEWVVRHRAEYCLQQSVDGKITDALSVAEFAEWLRPSQATITPPAAEPASSEGNGKKPLTPAIQNAWASWHLAVENHATEPTDREAYDWLTEQEFDTPLAGYELPAFDTWSSYVRKARRHHGENKYTPRAGRVVGKSVVKRNEI